MNKLSDIEKYYSSKLLEHGPTARGVDWNGEESQYLRFEQLIKILNFKNEFSINDYGCGFGAFFGFLTNYCSNFKYFGNDISAGMISEARKKYSDYPNANFSVGAKPDKEADYTVASGVLNVSLNSTIDEWEDYFLSTLILMREFSSKGFVFNCLTSYSDENKKRPHLYYADPSKIFDLCKKKFSRNVALLHDYDLYEFTVIVRL